MREIEKGRRRRIRKQLLDDLKGKIGRWKLKEEALGCTLWNTGFGGRYGPVVRQILRLDDEHFLMKRVTVNCCGVLWAVECDTVLLSGRWMDVAD